MTATLTGFDTDRIYNAAGLELVFHNGAWITYSHWSLLEDQRIEKELAALNISLSHDTCHPFKHNRPMFAAWEDGNEESGVVGYGTTEEQAITNFKNSYKEKYYY